MSSPGGDSVIKVAKNEWVLLSWRTIVGGMLSVALWLVNDIRTGQDRANGDIARLSAQFNDFRLTNEARISKVEGEVGLLRGSIEVHRGRLQGLDAETRSLWGRMFDMSKQKGNP